ncbi:Bro-N domain-containing protein [Erwinia aphidicola]|uniref:BRO-N domain-containing protein n=1 Tax=Erwinia aphidicola TaxID=68334 RepID=UPI0030D51CEA
MGSKKCETPLCANTNGASIENNRVGNIDMNIVAKSDLNFHGINLTPVADVTGVWLTSADVAKALGYKSTKSISNLFAQYEGEFSPGMTMVIESVTNGINGSSRRMKVRVFSLRGAHLIAMFARTPVAKEFRRWVLDILDREVAIGNISPTFDFEMYAHNAGVAKRHMEIIYREWSDKLSPSLRALGSPLAAELVERIKSVGAITYGLSRALDEALTNGKRIH